MLDGRQDVARLSRFPRTAFIVTALMIVFGWSMQARASSSVGGEEYLSTIEAVEPNIIFLIDLSSDMDDPCPSKSSSGDTGDTGSSAADTGWGDDTGVMIAGAKPPGASSSSSSGTPCIDRVVDAIDQVTQHFDWARFAVVGTAKDASTNEYYAIAPLGSSYSEISSKLSSVSAWSTNTRNLSEALASLSKDYLENTTAQDGVDDDGDGIDYDWSEAAIEYWCQETHIITITRDRPHQDSIVPSRYQSSISPDKKCTWNGVTTGRDTECLYDNVAYALYSRDLRSDLSGTQDAIVHTIGIGIEKTTIAESLFGNASDVIDGAGIYTVADTGDEILSAILTVMTDIREGTYTRSPPVISADGSYLIYSYYEIEGGDPLAKGHIRAYSIDDDPSSSTYGQVEYTGSSSYGGAIWDGGTLLVSRPVTSSESNPDDRDGFGKRDIYTFMEEAASLSGLSTESSGDHRQGFDYEFVQAVGSDPTTLDLILDTSTDSTGCASDLTYDLDRDGCNVDADDLQSLVDFTRGLPEAEFRYFDEERGYWKLGDSPHSVPVVVTARNNVYTADPTRQEYYKQLQQLEDDGTSPAIVLQANNDGMLHAYALEDDSTTADSEAGQELWAWIPGTLLYRSQDAAWAGRLIDQMLYGRTFLFDGSPAVEDVWIDEDGDGQKECTSVPDNCEWHRVVVVQQGKGGPVTLALDITDTTDPKFLWEQTDEKDVTAMGYTVGKPVIANVYNSSDSSNPHDTWVAMWGSGRAVPYSTSSTKYYSDTEADLFMWAIGDDYWGTLSEGIQDSGYGTADGSNGHPESSLVGTILLNNDSDSNYENAYISAPLAVVDVDSDGDADTIYFPVTTTYKPLSEGGTGPIDIEDPGSSWMYKACIDTSDPGHPTWAEFYDPVDDGGLTTRPTVYYAATTAWMSDGSLGVYWGTGTPYERTDTSTPGYLFAVKDSAPEDCSSFTVTPITDCGASGVYTLDDGEGLTSSPVVYAGVIYFTTWVPDADLCNGGEGRLYGLDFTDCSAALDSDGDGTMESYTSVSNSYLSGVTITNQGMIMVASSSASVDGSSDVVTTIEAQNDPFLGTASLAWMEVF